MSSPPFDTPHSGRGLKTQCNVLRDREIRKERRLLINAGDAELVRGGRCELLHALATNVDLAAVRPMRAGDEFDERRFACAIFPEQRVDFSRLQIEGDTFQRAYGAESLADTCQLQEGSGHGGGR